MSQSNGDALNEIKNQTKQIVHNKIEKPTPLLKEMPPPTVPPPTSHSSSNQCYHNNDGMSTKQFSQVIEEELDEETHKVVISMFSFARSLSRTINGGKDQKELEKFIINGTIKELEFHLKNHQ